MRFIERFIEDKIVNSLKAFPAVYIAGPRQSGKTTLVKHICASRHPAQYVTFDDFQYRSAAKHDPEAFLRDLKGNVVLDEVQLVPEVFRPLKIIVDENRQSTNGGRGKFLLTGSANVLALPQLCDALAGRMSVHDLMPYSATELFTTREANFIDKVFTDALNIDNTYEFDMNHILRDASYPEFLTLDDTLIRKEWCNSYIQTVLLRDVQSLIEVQKTASLPDMLTLLATWTGGLLNEASLARDLGLNHLTTKKYRILLECLFLTLPVPAWKSNLGKRLVKTPKIYMSDINLLFHLLRIKQNDLQSLDRMQVGKIFENFVAVELTKQLTFANTSARLYHYRTSSQQEVDFVLESDYGSIVGIEVKSTSRISVKDFRSLQNLKTEIGAKFNCGFVVHPGKNVVQFGSRLYSLPFASLWG